MRFSSVLAFACLAAVAVSAQLHASLRADNTRVSFTVTNPTNAAVTVLKWGTPLEGVMGDIFSITTAEGRRADYFGAIYKRGNPVPEDFVTLAAGQSLQATVDLAPAYLLWNGTSYSVSLDTTVAVLPGLLRISAEFPKDKLEFTPLATATVATTAVNPSQPAAHLLGLGEAPKMLGFIGCTSARTTIVNAACTKGYNFANAAYTYLTGSQDAAYKKWFGAYSGTTRMQTVTAGYNRIRSKMSSTSNFNVDCAPTACSSPSVYAYVYPSDSSFTVHLCGQFWNAGTTGFDTQGGTMVHEMSHFSVIQGTKDYAYGTSNAQALARTDPAKAIANADNYEYFVESGPSA